MYSYSRCQLGLGLGFIKKNETLDPIFFPISPECSIMEERGDDAAKNVTISQRKGHFFF